ncbi:Uu.00g034490.m01.CDS01 [Anthostomella pinea]|uniref:Uu.00g034490.m01.CDS01 n=1 Tax=Anthostomella pinea TaxID=933095 RepID=A0AAI8YDA1_9PEZI|nr:Uu.00g034490.m01.CDS01 [Anthostomella pinea]
MYRFGYMGSIQFGRAPPAESPFKALAFLKEDFHALETTQTQTERKDREEALDRERMRLWQELLKREEEFLAREADVMRREGELLEMERELVRREGHGDDDVEKGVGGRDGGKGRGSCFAVTVEDVDEDEEGEMGGKEMGGCGEDGDGLESVVLVPIE